jgi:hypothetical protein
MKHLKTYQLFESLEITEWSDIKDLINVVEDEFNFEFKQFKVTDDSSVGGDKIISFIFTGREWVAPLYKKDEDIYRWFIQQIVDIGQFAYSKDTYIYGQLVNWPEVIKLRSDYRIPADYYSQKFAKIKFPELTDIIIYKKYPQTLPIYEYHFNFKANVFPGLEWVIRNPQDKDLLRGMNPDMVIKNLFQYYCKRSFHDIDFNILSVFSDKENKLITPVKKRDIQLPFNLSDQFIIDITPVFLEKVFKSSGLIFRLQISRYDERSVTNPDRLRGHSIAYETDEKLKELGLNMTWKDIFIIEN